MTSIRVLTAMRLPDAFVARLSERCRLIGPLERSAADALPPEAREARALLTMGSLRTDAAMIEALPALELICCYGTGFEGVDRAHAAGRGITLANAGSANAAAVADFAIPLPGRGREQVAAWDHQEVAFAHACIVAWAHGSLCEWAYSSALPHLGAPAPPLPGGLPPSTCGPKRCRA